MYKPTVILTIDEKRQLMKLRLHYQSKNIDKKMTIQKAVAMAICDAHSKIFGQKKTNKKGISSSSVKGDDMVRKIDELFVKSDNYMSSQAILEELGLPSSDGRKLAVAMKKIEIVGKKIKTGKVYFCRLK